MRTLRLCAADDLTLVADGYGDPAAQPVVFLHGGGQTRGAWGAVPQKLADRGWFAVTVDLRGHGESDWSEPGAYGIDDFAGDVRALAAGFSRPPVMVGASLGGLSCLIAEGERDAPLLHGLVLVDIAHKLERAGVERVLRFMTAAPEGFASVDEAADAVAEYLPHRRRPRDTGGLERNLRQRNDGRWVWHWDPDLWQDHHREAELAVRYERAARALRLPVLLVRGARSDVLSAEGAQAFLDIVPQARLVDLADAAHMVAGDRNDAFAEAALDFLETLRG